MDIYGASGHAKVIIDIAKSREIQIDHVFDDDKAIKNISGIKVNHAISALGLDSEILLAIGNNLTRAKLAKSVQGTFCEFLAHLSAVVSPSAVIGKGTVVMANAVVNAHTAIGEHCILNTGAVLEHDCSLGDFVHISPNAAVAGGVKIGEGSHIGIGACIIPNKTIGKWVTVGAGTVIIEDVPDYATVVGNPGKVIKYSIKKHE